MKKKVYLITALGLALLLSGGVFTYTFTTGGQTINITAPTGDIATVNATSTQPDWNSVLDTVSDVETLRPMTAGDETGIASQFPTPGEHWDKVDEESSDDDNTYVYTGSAGYQEDLYHIADRSLGKGTIDSVVVYMVVRATGNPTQDSAYVQIKTGGTEYDGTAVTVTTSYATYSDTWVTNPKTGQGWTWEQIDTLQIGAGLRRPRTGNETQLTQVYAEVNYTYLPRQGNAPTGNLFLITPNPGYNKELAVKTYLLNSGNLTKAYQYLNLKLYLTGSLEAGQTPNYRMLTLENGVASFSIETPSANHTLSVIGGDYGLVSDNTDAWSAGWTVTPEFYTEVIQR